MATTSSPTTGVRPTRIESGTAVCVVLDTRMWDHGALLIKLSEMINNFRASGSGLTRFMFVEVGSYPPHHRFVAKASPFTVDVDLFMKWLNNVRFSGYPGQGFALADGLILAGSVLLEQRCSKRHCIIAAGSKPLEQKARLTTSSSLFNKPLTASEATTALGASKVMVSVLMNRYVPKLLQLFRDHARLLGTDKMMVSEQRDPNDQNTWILTESPAVESVATVTTTKAKSSNTGMGATGRRASTRSNTSKRRRTSSSSESGKNSRSRSNSLSSQGAPSVAVSTPQLIANQQRRGSIGPVGAQGSKALSEYFEKNTSWIGRVVFPRISKDKPLYLKVFREIDHGQVQPLIWDAQLVSKSTIVQTDPNCMTQLSYAKQQKRLLKFDCDFDHPPPQVPIDNWKSSQQKLYTNLYAALKKKGLVCLLIDEKSNSRVLLFAGSRQHGAAHLLGAHIGVLHQHHHQQVNLPPKISIPRPTEQLPSQLNRLLSNSM